MFISSRGDRFTLARVSFYKEIWKVRQQMKIFSDYQGVHGS